MHNIKYIITFYNTFTEQKYSFFFYLIHLHYYINASYVLTVGHIPVTTYYAYGKDKRNFKIKFQKMEYFFKYADAYVIKVHIRCH